MGADIALIANAQQPGLQGNSSAVILSLCRVLLLSQRRGDPVVILILFYFFQHEIVALFVCSCACLPSPTTLVVRSQ